MCLDETKSVREVTRDYDAAAERVSDIYDRCLRIGLWPVASTRGRRVIVRIVFRLRSG